MFCFIANCRPNLVTCDNISYLIVFVGQKFPELLSQMGLVESLMRLQSKCWLGHSHLKRGAPTLGPNA